MAISPGTRNNQVGHIIDFLPTFLEMAGAEYPKKHPEFDQPTISLDGKTLLPVLKGQVREGHEFLFWHWATNRAVRKGDWKLAWDKHEKKWELYNLVLDRTEAHDLAAEYPELVGELTQKWIDWANLTDVKFKP